MGCCCLTAHVVCRRRFYVASLSGSLPWLTEIVFRLFFGAWERSNRAREKKPADWAGFLSGSSSDVVMRGARSDSRSYLRQRGFRSGGQNHLQRPLVEQRKQQKRWLPVQRKQS